MAGGKTHVIAFCSGAAFSADSRWLACEPTVSESERDRLRKGENHSVAQKANQLDYHRRINEWFDHYVKGGASQEWIDKGVPVLERERELNGSGGGRGSAGRPVGIRTRTLVVGREILPTAGFQAALRPCARSRKRRLKAGSSQDWRPHNACATIPNESGR